MRVAVLYPAPAPYREKLFLEFSRQRDIDLCVYYCASSLSYRDWKFISEDYQSKVLPGREYGEGVLVNPGIVNILRKERPDIMVVWGWSFPTAIIALIEAYFLKIPTVVFSDTGMAYKEYSKTVDKTLKKIKIFLTKFPQAFIVQGKLSRDFLLHLGVPIDRINVLPINSVDTHYLYSQSLLVRQDANQIKEQMGIRGKRVIIFIGNLEPRKGFPILLEAFNFLRQEAPDLALLAVGEGPQREDLEANIARRRLPDIHLVGSQPYEILPRFLGISDCLVLPTLADHWPLVVVEALACGLPVVTSSRCGSVPELIEGKGTGIAVDPLDAWSLAQGIKKILALPPKDREALSQRALATAAAYDYRLAAKGLAEMLFREWSRFSGSRKG
jgi:glycosyltransferase involved in cell wall biosynthesis